MKEYKDIFEENPDIVNELGKYNLWKIDYHKNYTLLYSGGKVQCELYYENMELDHRSGKITPNEIIDRIEHDFLQTGYIFFSNDNMISYNI